MKRLDKSKKPQKESPQKLPQKLVRGGIILAMTAVALVSIAFAVSGKPSNGFGGSYNPKVVIKCVTKSGVHTQVDLDLPDRESSENSDDSWPKGLDSTLWKKSGDDYVFSLDSSELAEYLRQYNEDEFPDVTHTLVSKSDGFKDASGKSLVEITGYENGKDKVTLKHHVCGTVGLDDISFPEGKAPTCTKPGTNGTATCPICGHTEKVDEFPKLGHVVTEWTTTTDPTCTEKGKRTGTCTVCHNPVTEELAALGHSVPEDGWKTVTEPTCTEKGVKEGTCTVCGKPVPEELAALEHEYHWEETPATCTTPGERKGTCTRVKADGTPCGETVTEVLPALEHEYHWEETPATCTTPGERKGTCTRVNADGTPCGETVTEVIPVLEHSVDKWDVTVEPTCTEKGKKEGTCTICGNTITDEIPALGHSVLEWKTTDPTCTEKGKKEGTCTTCSNTITDEIPALGHNYVDGLCSRCNEPEPAGDDLDTSTLNLTPEAIAAPVGSTEGADLVVMRSGLRNVSNALPFASTENGSEDGSGTSSDGKSYRFKTPGFLGFYNSKGAFDTTADTIVILVKCSDPPSPMQYGSYKVVHEYYVGDSIATGERVGSTVVESVDNQTLNSIFTVATADADKVRHRTDYNNEIYEYQSVVYGKYTNDLSAYPYHPVEGQTNVTATTAGDDIIILQYLRAPTKQGAYRVVHEYYMGDSIASGVRVGRTDIEPVTGVPLDDTLYDTSNADQSKVAPRYVYKAVSYRYQGAVYGTYTGEQTDYLNYPYQAQLGKAGVKATENGDEIIILQYLFTSTTPDPDPDPDPDPKPEPKPDPKPELPDPNKPDSPSEITITEDDVPKEYVKVWDPDKEEYVYIPEDDVPRWDATPQTNDNSHTALWAGLCAASLGAMIILGKKKKDQA